MWRNFTCYLTKVNVWGNVFCNKLTSYPPLGNEVWRTKSIYIKIWILSAVFRWATKILTIKLNFFCDMISVCKSRWSGMQMQRPFFIGWNLVSEQQAENGWRKNVHDPSPRLVNVITSVGIVNGVLNGKIISLHGKLYQHLFCLFLYDSFLVKYIIFSW